MRINWTRADLSCWGEYIETPYGRYSKYWNYKDGRQNPDCCAFSIHFDGKRIASEIDGPTIDDAEAKADEIVLQHMREHMPEYLDEQIAYSRSQAKAKDDTQDCNAAPSPRKETT